MDETTELRVLEVDNPQAIETQTLAHITLPDRYFAFDATLSTEGDLLLACVFRLPPRAKQVVLFRIVGEVAEELSRYPVVAVPWRPLFFRDSLLVYISRAEHKWEVWEFRIGTGGERLQLRCVVLRGRHQERDENEDVSLVPEWCIANEALVAWSSEQNILSIHSML